jgi:hypothetical protein
MGYRKNHLTYRLTPIACPIAYCLAVRASRPILRHTTNGRKQEGYASMSR